MDLIILIVFVALAMLLSNIRTVKRRQSAVERQQEIEEENEDGTFTASLERRGRNQLDELLRQLIGDTNAESCGGDENEAKERVEEIDTEEIAATAQPYEIEAERPAYTRAIPNRVSATKVMAGYTAAATDNSIESAADTTVDEIVDSIETTDEQPLRDFDLRSAVLYSEILKPKFDNYQD